ncbi:hypothetical protein Glove_460g6 [Diversispora epigaea]|uniref:Uncharacterized protein n=1 Tax=Diversispora epigaea TaxID=1348612 RepID=A0A397GQG8_9GLOM|nr:hypothetical protein Glove_460g6 [Diversispora epigaea]
MILYFKKIYLQPLQREYQIHLVFSVIDSHCTLAFVYILSFNFLQVCNQVKIPTTEIQTLNNILNQFSLQYHPNISKPTLVWWLT